MFQKFTLLVFMLVLLGACNSNSSESVTNKQGAQLVSYITVDGSPAYVKRSAVAVDKRGKVQFLYVKNNKLFIQINKKNILLDEHVASRHFWLSSAGKYIYVFWWKKTGTSLSDPGKKLNKTIYVRVSRDGGKTFDQKKIINDVQGRPLANLNITSDAEGNASIFYLDERYPVYEVYVNSTRDGGKTWSKDLMLNDPEEALQKTKKYFAVTPVINKVGNQIIAVWHESLRKNGQVIDRVYSSVSIDNGDSWKEKKAIYEDHGNHSLQMKSYVNGDRLFLAITQAGKGVTLLHKKPGSDWNVSSSVAPGTEKAKSASYFSMASDDQYLYISYIRIPPHGSKKDWATILQRYDIKNNVWLKGERRLDAIFGQKKTRGGYQSISILGDGTLVAVWEDYRYILPKILLAYSTDQGESWSDAVVLNKVDKNTHVVEKIPFIKNVNGTAFVFFEYSDLKEGGIPFAFTKYTKIEAPVEKLIEKNQLEKAEVASIKEKRKDLEERFKKLMDLRISKKWDKTWNFIDPVYRNLYSKKSWLSSRGKLAYKAYKINSVEVNGAYGTVNASIEFDLTNKVPGVTAETTHLKNKRSTMRMQWGWFGDDWYYIAEDPRTPYMP